MMTHDLSRNDMVQVLKRGQKTVIIDAENTQKEEEP